MKNLRVSVTPWWVFLRAHYGVEGHNAGVRRRSAFVELRAFLDSHVLELTGFEDFGAV